ncbi:hypothetical protein EGX65_26135 [Escherichia coli]|nr:hypothetical protein [Salmonella enterica subsp. enterica serovar Newport]EED8953346.1 hypothetical protein [Salmonella enterica subsp. enterica serovar Newport]EFN7779602.1 hypothetical protein [Escherichia coli]
MLNDTKKNIRGYSTAPLVLIYGHHDIPAPTQHNGTHCHQTRHPGNILVALSTTDTSGYAIQLPAVAEKPQECADRQNEKNTREPAAPEQKKITASCTSTVKPEIQSPYGNVSPARVKYKRPQSLFRDIRFQRLNGCTTLQGVPFQATETLRSPEGAFLRSSKHWLVVARRLPSQTTGDLDGYPKITVVTRRRFSQTTETLDGHPKVTELTCPFSVALFILSRLRYQQFCLCMIRSPLSSNRSPNHVFTDDVISDEIGSYVPFFRA